MEGISSELLILAQSVVALLLGGLIGWERERAGKWAGLRTHMIVCLAVFLFVKNGEILVEKFQHRFPNEIMRTDPIRLLEAIVTGLSFLGAGAIFRDQERHAPHGLTTAASLLVTAPIAISVASNRYILAVGSTLIVLFVLRGVRRLENRFKGEPKL